MPNLLKEREKQDEASHETIDNKPDSTDSADKKKKPKKIRHWLFIGLAVLLLVTLVVFFSSLIVGFVKTLTKDRTERVSSVSRHPGFICFNDTTIVAPAKDWTDRFYFNDQCGLKTSPRDTIGYWAKNERGDSVEANPRNYTTFVNSTFWEGKNGKAGARFRSRSDSVGSRVEVEPKIPH